MMTVFFFLSEKYKNLWGLWVRAHAIIKNEGSLGDSDAEKGGLLSLTCASPPEWDCPPPRARHIPVQAKSEYPPGLPCRQSTLSVPS